MSKESRKLLIALSAGGANSELAKHGIGEEHVEELMVRIAMRLLSEGHRLAFGGTLGVADQPLTKQLIDTAQRWMDETTAAKVDGTKPETWPLVNFSAWPYYEFIDEQQRARLVGICRFMDINPAGISQDELNKISKDDKPSRDRYGADALTTMRKQASLEADLRIVWGGKIQGAAGWMAGILEEITSSLEQNKPVLVLGGFGGCVRLIADFLKKPNAEWPEQLNLAACANEARDTLLSNEERDKLLGRMNETINSLAEFRSQIHGDADTVRNISTKLLKSALIEESPREAINLTVNAARLLVGC